MAEGLDPRQQAELKARLEREAEELAQAGRETAAHRAPVELDQQQVGRLSRMDALQVQAMAAAQERRRTARRAAIRAALRRMEEDEYGWCQGCGEALDPRRLDLDPATPTCVACARG